MRRKRPRYIETLPRRGFRFIFPLEHSSDSDAESVALPHTVTPPEKPERWQEIEKLFHAARERPESRRAAFLEEACAGDGALREEVESLLAHKEAGSFLESPAIEVAAKALAQDDSELRREHGGRANENGQHGFPLPDSRKAGWRRHGDRVQGGRYQVGPEGGAEIPAHGLGERSHGAGALPAGGAGRLGAQSSAHLHGL